MSKQFCCSILVPWSGQYWWFFDLLFDPITIIIWWTFPPCHQLSSVGLYPYHIWMAPKHKNKRKPSCMACSVHSYFWGIKQKSNWKYFKYIVGFKFCTEYSGILSVIHLLLMSLNYFIKDRPTWSKKCKEYKKNLFKTKTQVTKI